MSYTVTTNAQPDCPCCCPPDGKKCFQVWMANWSCFALAWTGPIAGGAICLPVGTDTNWVQTAKDGTGCTYRKYVPYTPKHCCSANGDCAGLGDTATPALPSGGAAPADCCGCTPACLIETIAGCCGTLGPATFDITVATISSSPNCIWNTVSPFSVDKLDVSGLAGRTFTIAYVPETCTWQGTFDVTAWVKMKRCVGDGSGCAACTPTTVISTAASMTITYTPSTAPTFGFTITCTGGDLDDGTQALIAHNTTLDDEFVDCCTPFTASCPAHDPMTDTSFHEIYMDLVVGVPC